MSSRSRLSSRVPVLDESARRRRLRKALETLEQDNFHDDPHADLVMHKKIPKFDSNLDGKRSERKRNARSLEYFKQRFRKDFNMLLEEDRLHRADPPNYSSARAGPSRLPERHLCSVCGFPSNYTCVQCGTRFCCVRCHVTHQETRCLRWAS